MKIGKKNKINQVYCLYVKNERSGLKTFLIFIAQFYFLFDLFSFIPFLELGLGLE